jgi:DNA-binding IclR family transcriptional regulator
MMDAMATRRVRWYPAIGRPLSFALPLETSHRLIEGRAVATSVPPSNVAALRPMLGQARTRGSSLNEESLRRPRLESWEREG